jgi:hypothetical protein
LAYHPVPAPARQAGLAAPARIRYRGWSGGPFGPFRYGRASAVALAAVALLAFAVAVTITVLVLTRHAAPPVLHGYLVPPAYVRHGLPG